MSTPFYNIFMKLKGFTPAYLLSLFMWIVASLPGDDLNRIQRLPENPWLRFFLSDPFMHFLTFGLLTLLIFKRREDIYWYRNRSGGYFPCRAFR